MSITRRTFFQQTDVYRLFDAEGRLLYVGVATYSGARLEDHRRHKPWWPLVRSIDLTTYETRFDALYVEACAIRDERPLHNEARNESTAASGTGGRNLDPISTASFEVAA